MLKVTLKTTTVTTTTTVTKVQARQSTTSRFSGDRDAVRGLNTEARIIEFLGKEFANVRTATPEENKNLGIDVWIGDVGYDIKDQRRAEKTGRVCFEFATQRNGSSGYSPARQWAKDKGDYIIVVGKTLYFAKRRELKAWFINNGCMFDSMSTLSELRKAAQKTIGHSTTDVILGLVNLENLPVSKVMTLC